MLPINEFILWNNCSNNCQFCWQKREKQQTLNERLTSIESVKQVVQNLKNSHVLFVGGEIFDSQNNDLNNALKSLFDLTIDKMNKKDIELLYINTNILYDTSIILDEILEKLNQSNLINRVHFTTSADEYGRFINSNKNILFYNNLKKIRKKYLKLPIYVNLILTDSFCNDIINDIFNIKVYQDIYQVEVNTIPYIKFGKIISAPTRDKVFNTIIHLNEQLPGYGIKYCNNFLLNQDIILRKCENRILVDVSADKSSCQHSENFRKCYSDSEECFVCDCLKMKEFMESL